MNLFRNIFRNQKNPHKDAGRPDPGHYQPRRSRFETFAKYQVLTALARYEKSKKQDNDAERRLNERLVRKSTIAIACLTGVLAVVGIASAIFSALQWISISGQLNAMINDQRPWITLTSLPKIATPLKLPIKDISFMGFGTVGSIEFNIKNVGKSPARRVSVIYKLIGPPDSGDITHTQKSMCGSISEVPLQEHEEYIEFNVFPGEEFKLTKELYLFKSDYEKISKYSRPGRINIDYIAGCIDYKFMDGNAHHQTGFIYSLKRIKPGLPYGDLFYLDDSTIAPSEVQVSFDMVGTGEAN